MGNLSRFHGLFRFVAEVGYLSHAIRNLVVQWCNLDKTIKNPAHHKSAITHCLCETSPHIQLQKRLETLLSKFGDVNLFACSIVLSVPFLLSNFQTSCFYRTKAEERILQLTTNSLQQCPPQIQFFKGNLSQDHSVKKMFPITSLYVPGLSIFFLLDAVLCLKPDLHRLGNAITDSAGSCKQRSFMMNGNPFSS